MDIMQTEGLRKTSRHSAPPVLAPEQRAPLVVDRLDEAARATLLRWASGDDNRRRGRSHIVLLSADGLAAEQVGARLGLATPTVYKWLRRFTRHGLAGLSDLPRSGQPHRLPAQKRAEILRVTRDELPPQGSRWTIRVAARHLGVTQHQVRQVWADAGLKPHELPAAAPAAQEPSTPGHGPARADVEA